MIQTYHKSYNQFLPFSIVLVFEREGKFNEMEQEAAKRYPALASLKCTPIAGNVMSFVYCPPETNTIYMFATGSLKLDILVHECVHIVMRVFEAIGADMCEETEEFFAYIQEMVFRDILTALKTKFDFIPELPGAKRQTVE